MIHFINLHPYWSFIIFMYLVGIGLFVWGMKGATYVDENDNPIDKEILRMDREYD